MSLPKPYYQDNAVTIYHGDCRSILPGLPKVDLVLTDPPYNLPASISGTRKTFYRSLTELNQLEYFFRDFFAWCNSALRASGVYYIFCDGQSYPVFYSLLFGYVKSIRPLIWDKLTSINGYSWRHQHELILFAENINAPVIKTGDGDILRYRAVPVDDRKHPAEKPIELLSQLIAKHETDTILDPFMGSGTTLRAAKDLGRKSIGIEIEERYCEIAAKRMQQSVMNLAIEPNRKGEASAETLSLPLDGTHGIEQRGLIEHGHH